MTASEPDAETPTYPLGLKKMNEDPTNPVVLFKETPPIGTMKIPLEEIADLAAAYLQALGVTEIHELGSCCVQEQLTCSRQPRLFLNVNEEPCSTCPDDRECARFAYDITLAVVELLEQRGHFVDEEAYEGTLIHPNE